MKSILLTGLSYSDLHHKIDLLLEEFKEVTYLNIHQDNSTNMYYASFIYKEKPKRKVVKKDE